MGSYRLDIDPLAIVQPRELSRSSNPARLVGRGTRVMILWAGLGEYAWAKRLEIACERLGWQSKVLYGASRLSYYEKLILDTSPAPGELLLCAETFKPDFAILLQGDLPQLPGCANYLCVTGTVFDFFDRRFSPSPRHLNYEGFLTAAPGLEKLREYFAQNGRTFRQIPWYPTAQSSDYLPTEPRRLFYSGFQWDTTRNGCKYRKLFSLLDKQGNLDIYGPVEKWDCAKNSVRGMTFEPEKFRSAMRDSGIVLIIHSQFHLDLEVPSARIFEAAAAGCVIISDRHPFIVREFGDAVLYFDQNRTAQEIFEQISTHKQWIDSHPEEATVLAEKAHAIFSEKYTAEDHLQRLLELHEGAKGEISSR